MGQRILGLLCVFAAVVGCSTIHHGRVSERTFFQAFTNFNEFTRTRTAGAVALVSPEMNVGHWNELVASWNAVCPRKSQLVVEARAFDGSHWTRYYTLGIWSENGRRESVRKQEDRDATVKTDTLVMKRPMRSAQLRLTLTSDSDDLPLIKFLSASFLDSTKPVPLPTRTNQAAWGKTIAVPERSQLGYPNGTGWCSPTAVSMLLAYWSRELQRQELDLPVPMVAAGVHDPGWGGTGNWPFNMAFAGRFPGLRAFVTRFDELAEVEDFIAAGIPIALSVSFDHLNGKERDLGNGHLILAVGFTETGDVVVNDPWPNPKKENRVRKVFPRDRVIKAWKKSDQAVYVIHPETWRVPVL